MAGLHFDITGNNTDLKRKLDETKRGIEEVARTADEQGGAMEGMFSRVAKVTGSIGAAISAKQFVGQVVEIRGQMQQLEASFNTMLQSKAAAEQLMQQMVETAATTPFDLQSVASGAKSLLAYGVAADEVNDTLVRLGDIAAGLSIPLGDLVYLYGTTMAQGRLYTQDLNQFTSRGIPMIQELAKQFGVAESAVKGLVESGKVGFPEVRKVIESLTDEGGKFGGLMEAQSKTIAGQISNLGDSFAQMLNDIGKSNEGFINSTLSAAGTLVDHYQAVGDVLMTLVASYGVYKASLMAVTAYSNAAYSYEITQLRAVVSAKTEELDTDLAQAVAKGRITASRAAEVQMLRAEIAEKMQMSVINDRIAQSELRAAQIKYASLETQLTASKAKVVSAQQEYAAAVASGNAEQIAAAKTNLATAAKERNALSRQTSAAKMQVETAVINANTASQARATLATKADTAQKKIQATTTSVLTLANNALSKSFKTLTAAMAKNPFGLILVVVTSIIGALVTMNDTMGETAGEVDRFGESTAKSTRNLETLLSVVNNTNRNSKVHKDAMSELVKVYGDYGIKIDRESDQLAQVNSQRERLIELIRQEGEERRKANLIEKIEKQADDAGNALEEALRKAYESAEVEGTGFIDDWDADQVQEKANELAMVVRSLIESEFDNLSNLPEDKIEAEIQKILGKIDAAYGDLGLSDYGFVESDGKYASILDADEEGKLRDYIATIREVARTRNSVIDTFDKGADAAKVEAESIDVTTMSFGELVDKVERTNDSLDTLGKTDISPKVDISHIVEASRAANSTLDAMMKLAGLKPVEFQLPTATADGNGKSSAVAEIEKRIAEAAKTRQGVADLLSEIDAKLKTAERGSAQETALLAYQKRLQAAQASFRSNRTSKGGKTAAELRKEYEEASREVEEAMKRGTEERKKTAEELAFEIEQKEIELEEDAVLRKSRQLDLDHKKEQYQLERNKEAAIEAEKRRQKEIFDAKEQAAAAEAATKGRKYEVKEFTEADVNTGEIQKILGQYARMYELLKAAQGKERQDMIAQERQSMNEYLSVYGDYAEKRRSIIAKGEAAKVGKNIWEQKSIDKETEKQLSALDEQANKTTSAITALFGDMRDKTLADLKLIGERGKEALEFLKGGKWDAEKGASLGITEANFNVWKDDPEKIEAIGNGLKQIDDNAKQLRSSYDKVKDGVTAFFAAGSDPKKLNEALQDIDDGLNQIMQTSGFLKDTFSQLGDAFGSDALKGISEGIGVAMDAMDSAMQGAQAGAIFGPIGAAAGAALGLVSSLASSIAKIHDAKNEKRIQKLQDQIDALDRSYEKLGKSIEKAFSTDASKMIEQQNEMLRQQKVLIQGQIAEEQAKKNADSERIKDWQKQLDDINEQIEENKEKQMEAIAGTSVMSAIDEFAQAYADAWANGTDAAEASTKAVKSLIQTSLLQFLKKQLSPDVEKFMADLAEYMADGIISPWEDAQLNKLKDKMDETAASYYEQTGKYFEDSEAKKQQSASGRGFEAMSQDTADELNGRFTALHEVGLSVVQSLTEMNVQMSVMDTERNSILSEMRNLLLYSTSYLEDIVTYNKKIYNEFLEKIDTIDHTLKTALL